MLRSLPAVAIVVLCAVAGGCFAEGDAGQDETSSSDAFTVARGDRFVVSATPRRIVLSKEVDGTKFPFDEAALKGKALLIHPVAGKADAGVYTRAAAVTSDGSRLIIDGEPLTLAEMAAMSENDVVRIYVDPARTAPAPLHPESAESIHPLTNFAGGEGTAFSLHFPSLAGLSRAESSAAGISIHHDVKTASITPTPVVRWSKEQGLELGLALDLAWDSKLTVKGYADKQFVELFRSEVVQSAPYVVTLMIGPVPVPIVLSADLAIVCMAKVTGSVDTSLGISASANVAGSVIVQTGENVAPDQELRVGSVTPRATGSVHLTPTFAGTADGAVACNTPRMQLKALVGGIAGPYVAFGPAVTIAPGGALSYEAALYAGVEAELRHHRFGHETKLLTWKPL